MAVIARDRLRDLLDLLLESLDEGRVDGAALAARAAFSRFHFDRIVQAGLGESPASFRRRLLLERAAWQLVRGASVTDAALAAGYGSLEAFTRAFARAHGDAPSRWHGPFRLPAPNGVHFHPPAGLLVPGPISRSRPMDLTDRLLEHDLARTRELLDRAAELEDDALDRPVRPGHVVLAFEGEEPSARAACERLVFTKEVWNAAIAGESFPERGGSSLPALRARLDRAGPAFVATVREIRDRGTWNHAFVDALCEPPESFSFGGVVAHVLTFSAHRRQVLGAVLAELGVQGLGDGDPILWEAARHGELG